MLVTTGLETLTSVSTHSDPRSLSHNLFLLFIHSVLQQSFSDPIYCTHKMWSSGEKMFIGSLMYNSFVIMAYLYSLKECHKMKERG